MSLVLLGIDGLDAGLLDRWEIDSFNVGRSKSVETFSYSEEIPKTTEVWPTVATGVHPEEHGVDGKTLSDWNNVFLNKGSNYTHYLPQRVTESLYYIADQVLSKERGIKETEHETVFDRSGRTVRYWPGVKNSEILMQAWRLTDQSYSKNAFHREVSAMFHGKLSWVQKSLEYDPALVGTHTHRTDIMGHKYASQNGEIETLKEEYEKVGQAIESFQNSLDEEDDIILLSDHGMKNHLLDSEPSEYGNHSFRAFASTTLEDEIPESLLDFSEFIESNTRDVEEYEPLDMPKDRLEDLGYI